MIFRRAEDAPLRGLIHRQRIGESVLIDDIGRILFDGYVLDSRTRIYIRGYQFHRSGELRYRATEHTLATGRRFIVSGLNNSSIIIGFETRDRDSINTFIEAPRGLNVQFLD